jgi:hypothetical protein
VNLHRPSEFEFIVFRGRLPRTHHHLFLLSTTAKNYRHPGNQELLNLVRQNAASFHLGSLSDRKAIATAIVDQIRLGGGRFLRYHMSDNVWRDVEGDAAHYKVMQALRETKPAMDFLKDDVLKVRDCGGPPWIVVRQIPFCLALHAHAVSLLFWLLVLPKAVIKLGGGTHLSNAVDVRSTVDNHSPSSFIGSSPHL